MERKGASKPFDPEEAGIMLDRIGIELAHAIAKNPGAVPALQNEAEELLDDVGSWLAKTDPDQLPMSALLVASELEPSQLAQTLRELGHDLLVLVEVADAPSARGI